MNSFPRNRFGNALGVLACAGLIAYAYYSQFELGLEPCPLCIFQRIAVAGMGVIFLIAALHNPATSGSRGYAVLLLIVAAMGAGVAGRHVWIQAQPPGTVAACGAGLDYMMEIMPLSAVISKVLTGSGECSHIDWTLLGLSMPWWVLFSIVALGVWALIVNWPARQTSAQQWRK